MASDLSASWESQIQVLSLTDFIVEKMQHIMSQIVIWCYM